MTAFLRASDAVFTGAEAREARLDPLERPAQPVLQRGRGAPSRQRAQLRAVAAQALHFAAAQARAVVVPFNCRVAAGNAANQLCQRTDGYLFAAADVRSLADEALGAGNRGKGANGVRDVGEVASGVGV